MEITVSKKDVLWGYMAQFFNLATGLITLPLILKLLSADEVGFNYILISINSIVVLLDLGFSGQFSRYLTYIFSGAQKIQKDGISKEYSDTINEHLLASTIKTARRIYLIISLITSFFLLTFGTWYIYKITGEFTSVNNTILIWSIFCLSSFFNVYFLYLNAFLLGRGLVKEAKQALVYSKIVQVIITFAMLLSGCGLLSVVVANFLAPFVLRYFAYKEFFTIEIKKIIDNNIIYNYEIKEIFSILWYNAKKMGLIGVLSSAIGYASTLVMGSYLPLVDVASYGLLVQLTGVIVGIGTIHFYSIAPQLSSLMVTKKYSEIRRCFGESIFIFYIISVLGSIGVIAIKVIFELCEFDTQLPQLFIVILFYIYRFLEQNQSLFSQLFLFQNDLRFFNCAVWTGIISFASLCFSLYLEFGLVGVVLSQSIPLFSYAAWKWPKDAVIEYEFCIKNDFFYKPVIKFLQMIYGRFI